MASVDLSLIKPETITRAINRADFSRHTDGKALTLRIIWTNEAMATAEQVEMADGHAVIKLRNGSSFGLVLHALVHTILDLVGVRDQGISEAAAVAAQAAVDSAGNNAQSGFTVGAFTAIMKQFMDSREWVDIQTLSVGAAFARGWHFARATLNVAETKEVVDLLTAFINTASTHGGVPSLMVEWAATAREAARAGGHVTVNIDRSRP